MVSPLIHIGYHKTATSWLQKCLFGVRDRGFYPLTPETTSDPKTAAKFLEKYFVQNESGQILSPFVSRAPEIRDIISKFDVPNTSVPVISSERLSGNPHVGGFDSKLIANRLAESFPDAKILIVIREQTSMIISTYFQYLLIGGVLPLKKFLQTTYDGRKPGFSLDHFKYDMLIEHYRELFGKENVLVLPYEMFSRDPAGFIEHIGNFSGADIPADLLDYSLTPNKRASKTVLHRTRLLHPFLYRQSIDGISLLGIPRAKNLRKWLRKFLEIFVSQQAEEKFLENMTQEISQDLNDFYIASNKKTQNLTGYDLGDFGYKIK